MTDQKAIVSKSRQKRTKESTRKVERNPRVLTLKILLVTLLLWHAVMAVLHFGAQPVITELTPGQTAPFTLQAEVDFETTDLDATELRRERRMNEVPPVLALSRRRLQEIERNLDRFLDRSEAARKRLVQENNDTPLPANEEFVEVLDLLNLPAALRAFPLHFSEEQAQNVGLTLREELRARWDQGIISESNRQSAFQGYVPNNQVQVGAGGPIVELDSLPTPTEAADQTTDILLDTHVLDDDQEWLLRALLTASLEPNLSVDAHATRMARQAAAQRVEPVLETRRRGELLMEARTRLSEQQIRDIHAHAERLRTLETTEHDRARVFSQGLLLLLGLAMSVMLMILLQRDLSATTSRLILWATLTLLSVLLARFLLYLSGNLNLIPGYLVRPLLPLAIAPLLASILHGPRFALAVGISSSLAVSLSQDVDLMVFFSGLALTLTAALSVRSIHKRSNLFRAGLWIGGMKALLMLAAAANDQVHPLIFGQQALGAFTTGMAATLLALLIIPIFEYLFKVTTDIRLLELSDMSNPLLARLAMEAPGTYHHSLMVAHLAQTASREIRANDLLVRVCAYYHDIGKLTKPEFFIENAQGRDNPHDDLSPSMSRLIVVSHVKEGVSLAQRYKLPRIIVDGIEQHHGTSVIQYFYFRARSRAEENPSGMDKVQMEDYRYPGPRPKSREMGILMLADSIEAASRTIDKNKPGQIDGLVQDICREKLLDGQLDLCGLTMAEITAVRRSFIFSLNNMLHGRVSYPKNTDQAAVQDVLKDVSKAEPQKQDHDEQKKETGEH